MPQAKRHQYRSATPTNGGLDFESMTDNRTPSTPMELLLSTEYDWLRVKCSQISHSLAIKKGVKVNVDELFVDTVAKAIRLQHNYTDRGLTLRPWLTVVAKNQAITMANVLQKKAAKHQETTVTNEDGEEIDFLENMEHPDLQGNSIEGDLISRFNMQQINDAIENIHPQYAEVIRLNMIDGLTYAQISAKLDIPQNTVSSRVSRGREELAPVLKDLAIEFGITGKKKEK